MVNLKNGSDMKKIQFLTVAAVAMGLCVLWGCEDNRTQYLDEYDTLVYFRNGGEQVITLYSVGNDARYAIPVCKGGSESGADATARIVPMGQDQLDIYNMANETRYIQLPADCYQFLTPLEISFSASDRYRVAEVELKTDRIRAEQEAVGNGGQYVLALQLYSDEKVSRDINRLLLVPEVDVPVVTFSAKAADVYAFTPESPEENILSSTLTINMPASSVEWDFDCTVEALGQDWLDAYNVENGTEYGLLSPAQYTLPDKIHFSAGKAEAPFEIVVNRTGFNPFEYFAVPVRLVSCSKPELQVDEDAVYLAVVRLEPSLELVSLTADMLSSPYTHSGDGQGIPALIDGDVSANSWWHSYYGGGPVGDPVYGYYIDVALASPLNVIRFTYWTRSNNNGVPATVRVGVSNDGENWEMIGEVNSGLPTGGLEQGTLPTFFRDDSFTYVRFGIAVSSGSAGGDLTTQEGTNQCTALSELQLEGATL